MSTATARALPSLLLLVCLMGCRALTEPGLRPEPSTSAILVEGQILLPDGSPSPGGELLVDNRIYEDDRDDWIQARVTLDEEGRFSIRLSLGPLCDVVFHPPEFLELPSHRFLGVAAENLPWSLRHPMREVTLSLDVPDSIRAELDDGTLHLRQSRPRPAGENPYGENYLLPIDSTATVRGWILPGAHEVELTLNGRQYLRFEFPDSVRSPADEIPSLRPWLRGQTVELVLPQGVPPAGIFDLNAHQDLPGETTGGRIHASIYLSRDRPQRWVVLPRDIEMVQVNTLGFGVVAGLLTRTFFEIDDGILGPVRLGQYWLELVAPAGSSGETYDRVTMFSATDEVERRMSGGKALFLLDDGNYLIEVRDREDRLVGRRTYEATQSQSLTLDF